MERLSKFAIYLGIGMGITLFVLFLYAAIPGIIQSSTSQWEQLENNRKSESELKAKFQKHPAYFAMYERFPDAKEEFLYQGGGNGNMRVGIMNYETNKQMILEMYYNNYEDRINASVSCMGNNSESTYADSLFAEDFIKNTNCLEIVSDSKIKDSKGLETPQSPSIIID
jgi:hypothetical protein